MDNDARAREQNEFAASLDLEDARRGGRGGEGRGKGEGRGRRWDEHPSDESILPP